MIAADLVGEAWKWLTEPFYFQFLQRAFVSAFVIGALCGLVGVYVTLRRLSYIGTGLAYSIFGGAVVSYALKINFYLGSTAWGFLAALLIIWTARRPGIEADAVIGVISTASFAIGVVILSVLREFNTDFDAALFGNILSINNEDMYVIVGTGLVISLLIFFLYKQLLFTTFDSQVAAIYGVKTTWIDLIFALILAAIVITSMQVVGVTLIAASLITPPTIARLLTNSFNKMLLFSVLIGAFGGLLGVYASWYLNWATGATIVLTHSTLFGLVLIYTNLRRIRLVHTSKQAAKTS